MRKFFLLIIVFAGVFMTGRVFAQDNNIDITKTEVIYKTIGDVKLKMHIFDINDRDKTKPAPAVVFFFGGGWVGGNPEQFFPFCRHLAKKGIVAASAEYRIKSRHNTSPFECVADGKTAVRWIRQNAKSMAIDPNKIIAGGGSAGGHVAACTGAVSGFDDKNDDPNISSVPNLMILFNPVIDTSEKGYGHNKLGDRWKEISPLHHVKSGICPTIIFHGTADKTVPIQNQRDFTKLMTEAGNQCQLVEFQDKKHGFFNAPKGVAGKKGNIESYTKTLAEMDNFLCRQGYIAKNCSAKKSCRKNTSPAKCTPGK